MRTSEKIGALVEALAKAKASIKAPKKGSTVDTGKYKYSYTDRADVIEAYVGPLAANGLVIVHAVSLDESPHSVLHTRLMHSSGEWIESSYPISNVDDAKVLGSWLTYLERYQSCALVDIAGEADDDGERAVAPKRPAVPAELPAMALRKEIAAAAEVLAQRGEGGLPDQIIEAASTYVKEGKTNKFTDPFLPRISEGWLKATLGRLTKQLAESEPGAAEGADLFK